ncbi:MAG TPA: 3'(2'),5'-bisphosphate nucleotidase [Rhizobiales bacterium]|nr:3'(2'),5'-bisphosphate nucleotidase [Hyphomicrobiales bacterium]
MKIYHEGAKVTLKGDNSPVTQADVEAEDIILKGLAALDPDTPVIAEEAVAGGKEPKASPRFYLVDPLDGTREFISGNGEFTVNIAVIEEGEPVCGVIFAPAIGRLFCGAKGQGAWKADFAVGDKFDETVWQKFETPALPDKGVIAVASRSHRDQETQDWLEAKQVDEIVSAGSSLKFCLVATGEAHLYPRFGRTMEWDTAAGHGIVVAAGGQVLTLDGTPLRYGKEERGFDNPAFFVSSAATAS